MMRDAGTSQGRFGRNQVARWIAIHVVLAASLSAGRIVAQEIVIDFDDVGPTATGELEDYFDFLGADKCVGGGACWHITTNAQNAANGTNALHTTSDGDVPPSYFSRVAVLRDWVFCGQDLEFSAEVTWDDQGGDANDHAGIYFRFQGESDVPEENEFYFVRIDAADAGAGAGSTVNLHRMKGGVHEQMASATDVPLVVAEGDAITLGVHAVEDEITVFIDGDPVPGMDPIFDFDPLLGAGRVGFGENTNPAYFDEISVTKLGDEFCPCSARRAIEPRRYQPGDKVTVTLRATNVQGATTLTDTFPAGWTVSDAGGGVVDANSITFALEMDGEVSYELAVPANFCGVVDITGGIAGAGECDAEIEGDVGLSCRVMTEGEVVFDFDEEDPILTEELEDFFEFLGIATQEWRVDENLQNLDDPSQALHITSDGEQGMETFFSRAAIVHADVFLAKNLEFSVDITFDDQGGDANDHAGAYFRFTGDSDDPFGNEFYYLRIDSASVGDTGSTVNLHRLKNGSQQELVDATDFPLIIEEGDTVNVTIQAVDDQITVLINEEPVPGMSPYVDADPILVCGRVGVGEHTNPAYFDNFLIINNDDEPCPCVATRALSTRRYAAGDTVKVTLSTRDTSGTSTLVDTFPDGWTVSESGGGTVAGNEITFTLDGDGEASYELAPPADFCEATSFSGTLAAAGGCQVEIDGDAILVCVDVTPDSIILDFDEDGPLEDGELADFFDLYGFDNCVGPNPCWNIAPNGQDQKNDTKALHTVSDGEQLQNYFSRVAIVKPEIFEAQDLEYSVDLTFDDRGGDANDHAGVYFRFNGESDEPLENEYYFLRIDAGGDSSSINLHKVKNGAEQTLVSAANVPFTIVEGDTVTVSVRAEETEISAWVNGLPIPGMDPYLDTFDTILGCGRVGVGENTNPAYFDDFAMTKIGDAPCPCAATRTFSPRRYVPGESVTVTLRARNATGATQLTDTFPAGWTLTDAGGGTVAGNTVKYDITGSAEVSYVLSVPLDSCEEQVFSGELSGPDCEADVAGRERLPCLFGCETLHPSGGVREMLIIGPIDLGGNAGPDCDDNGRLEVVDYRSGESTSTGDAVSEATIEAAPGDEFQLAFSEGGVGVLFAPNVDINPRAGDGVVTVWLADADNQGFIDFDDADNVGAADDFVIYSLVYLDNTTGAPLDVILEVGTDDSGKVLLNGEMVHFVAACRAIPAAGSGDLVPVTLRPGRNTVLIAVVEQGGNAEVRLIVQDEFGVPIADDRVVACLAPKIEPAPGAALTPGDVNGDGGFNISDPVAHLNFLFAGGPLPECFTIPGAQAVELSGSGKAILDFNGDGSSNIADPVGALNFLFGGGNNPGHALGEECVTVPGECVSNCQ